MKQTSEGQQTKYQKTKKNAKNKNIYLSPSISNIIIILYKVKNQHEYFKNQKA